MTLTDRYAHARAETRWFVRVFAEVMVFAYTDTRARLGRTRDILTGRAPTLDEPCQMKGCDDHSVGVFPRKGRWKDDVSVCRFHWVSLHVMVRVVLATILTALLAGPLVLMVVFA